MTRTLYLGVDIAQATLEAAVHDGQQVRRLGQFANDAPGFAQLAQAVRPWSPPDAQLFLVLEPTGGYELALVAFAHTQGWQVCLPNPKQVRDWGKGQGRRGKNDRRDADLLAGYGADKHPAPSEALPPELQELAELLHRQADLAQLLRAERNRLHALQARPQPTQAVLASLARSIQHLTEELAEIEQALAELGDHHPDLKAQAKRLRSVPGIGQKTVWPVLLFLYRFQARAGQAADKKGVVAFAGLDPQPWESGTSLRHRPTISRQGDRQVRALLFMAALGGVRGRNPLRSFYCQLVGRGKAKRLALVAAARKILVWAWTVFCQGCDFDRARYPDPAQLAT